MARPKPPEAALLASPDDIEHQFYDALQRGDIERLMAVWSDDDDITCVHPGGPRVNGAAAIRSAFEAMFSNGAIDAHPEKVRRIQNGSSAVHSVLEPFWMRRTFSGCASMAPFENMASNADRMAAAPFTRGPPGCTQVMSSSSDQTAIRRSMSPRCRAS